MPWPLRDLPLVAQRRPAGAAARGRLLLRPRPRDSPKSVARQRAGSDSSGRRPACHGLEFARGTGCAAPSSPPNAAPTIAPGAGERVRVSTARAAPFCGGSTGRVRTSLARSSPQSPTAAVLLGGELRRLFRCHRPGLEALGRGRARGCRVLTGAWAGLVSLPSHSLGIWGCDCYSMFQGCVLALLLTLWLVLSPPSLFISFYLGTEVG